MTQKTNAYLISAYLEPLALKRLVDALNIEHKVDFYIHIDAKASISQFLTPLQDSPNVIFLKGCERVAVHWGGYSQVQMQYNLIQKMLSSNTTYLRIFNLTGTDYPLVSNRTLLTLPPDNKEFIIGYDVSHETKINPQKGSMQNKFLYYHFMDTRFTSFLNRRHIKKKNRYDLLGYDFYFGSEYWCLSYNCLKDIFQIYSGDKKLQKILRYSFVPSEAWIHTVFFNSKWASQGERYCDIYKGLHSLSPVHYFEYGEKIKILTEKDWEKISSSGKFFCRKVQSGVSDKLILQINKTRQEDD